MRKWLALVLFFLLGLPARGEDRPRVTAWASDIDFAVGRILEIHPSPFTRVGRETFLAGIDLLKRDLPRLTDDEIAVRLMQAVASLRDGHTTLFPASGSASGTWFPVRFCQFADGLFITAIDPPHASLAGAQVVQIGDKSAAEALALAQSAFPADNAFSALQAPVLLSSPRVVRGLHIAAAADRLPLRLVLRSGESVAVDLPAVEAKSDFDFLYYGEMFGPVDAMVTAFDGKLANDFLKPELNAALPLHLRGRLAFWFTYLPDEKLIYLQLNAMREKSSHSKETLSELLARMWRLADQQPVDKLVLDLRYNSGGNGGLVDGIVHELIRREGTLNREGHLFTIVGRKTYSAGADLAVQLGRHTHTAFLGEPMGAAPRGFGDADSLELPQSKMHLTVSTNGTVAGKTRDQRVETPVQFPAQFSSAEYFGGQDPALDVVRNAAEHADLIDVLRKDGAAAARKLYDERKKRYGTLSWWQPFDRETLNEEGFRLLEQGRKDEGIEAFRLVVDRYPDRWEPWDSLAEGYMKVHKYPEGIAAYRKALELNPNNWNAGFARKSIATMEAELQKQAAPR